jgi:hypothetical protein
MKESGRIAIEIIGDRRCGNFKIQNPNFRNTSNSNRDPLTSHQILAGL